MSRSRSRLGAQPARRVGHARLSLAVGILAGGPAWVHVPLTAFWFVGYFAFFATSLWLKARRRPRYWPPVRAYGIGAALLGLVTLAVQPSLIVWAPLFILPLGVGLWAAAARRERELLSGLTTVVGSGLMTVVAYAAGPGTDLQRAWLLALTQFLYFAGTVFYVKSAIRERGNERFLWLSIAAHAVATVVVLTFPVARVGLPPAHRPRRRRASLAPLPSSSASARSPSTVVVAVVSLLTV